MVALQDLLDLVPKGVYICIGRSLQGKNYPAEHGLELIYASTVFCICTLIKVKSTVVQ